MKMAKELLKYNEKRNFKKTAEPEGIAEKPEEHKCEAFCSGNS
jgi:hypothetical protein